MATDLYDLSVPAFTRGLHALDSVLDKAVAHAAATGQDVETWLEARLASDMHPLRRQVQIRLRQSQVVRVAVVGRRGTRPR